MIAPKITLTTDFGADSPYVAQMKGVILSFCAEANVVDITHSVAPQNIAEGGLILEQTTPWFPEGSIHVAVVDPGVGTDRNIVCMVWRRRRYIAPDNGLLSRLLMHETPEQIVKLTNPQYWGSEISATFHGRDIMAPAAAHLALGVSPEALGEPIDSLVEWRWPTSVVERQRIVGEVLSIDSFGNLITNIPRSQLFAKENEKAIVVRCMGCAIHGVVSTYASASPNSAVALISSGGMLEIAISGGNAACMLGAQVGAAVTVELM